VWCRLCELFIAVQAAAAAAGARVAVLLLVGRRGTREVVAGPARLRSRLGVARLGRALVDVETLDLAVLQARVARA